MTTAWAVGFGLVWAVFWIYWLAAAFSVKRGRVAWRNEVLIRVVIVGMAIVAVRLGAFRHDSSRTDLARALVGSVLLLAGLALAVWARRCLGRNWGTPMTRKRDPELVTSGPYRRVRHPIYSGILTAGIGTAVALNWAGLVVVLFAGVYFLYSARVEERFMAESFPEAYPAYRGRTKMIVPFLI